MTRFLLGFTLFAICASAMASISESKLARLKGYTVLGSYEITGWRDKDGKKGDAYEGCNYGRILILDNNLKVTCTEYWYEYEYHPSVIIMGNGTNLKMILNGEVHDVE